MKEVLKDGNWNNIQKISTKDGKVLVITDKDDQKYIKLKEEIERKPKDIETRQGKEARLKKEIVHAKCIEVTTSREELLRDVTNKMGRERAKKGEHKSVRPRKDRLWLQL